MNTYNANVIVGYIVDEVSEGCWDLFVSDNDGFEWHYYGTFETRDAAYEEGEAAVWRASRESYISHGK